MSHAQKGNKVKVHYTGRLADGTVFDSSRGRDPLEFTLGSGMVIVGFDNGVTGLKVGESKTVEIPAAEAYGEARPEMIIRVPKAAVPPEMVLAVGQELGLPQGNGSAVPVIVTEITDSEIVLDANHRLAGKDLIFDLELMEILSA
jgi:peptidylprolyl isomerase